MSGAGARTTRLSGTGCLTYPAFGQTITPITNDWLSGAAARLGQYPDEVPVPIALQTNRGGATRNGLLLDFYLSFESLPSGLLALVDWLSQQGCSTFRYTIYGGAG
ncbi:MAG: hypothetical protein WD845_11765 [Pirellulales bacterium]